MSSSQSQHQSLQNSQQPSQSMDGPTRPDLIYSRNDMSSMFQKEATKTKMKPITLTFFDGTFEQDYQQYFLDKHLWKWRLSMVFVAIISCFLALYSMVKTPHDRDHYIDLYRNNQHDYSTFNSLTTYLKTKCPSGMFCLECPYDSGCTTFYESSIELVIFLLGTWLPLAITFALSYYLDRKTLAKYVHLLSALLLTNGLVITVLLRFYILEPKTPYYIITLICAAVVFPAHVFLKLRFIYTLVSIAILNSFFIAFSVLSWINFPVVTSDDSVQPQFGALLVSIFSLFAISVEVCFSSYENEYFTRSQFFHALQLQRTNKKLYQQLKNLQRKFGDNAATLNTPLEKALLMLQSVLADPSLSGAQMNTLAQALQLLQTSNLLSPELETNKLMDNEQEAWLFSLISKRKKEGGSSTALLQSRRKSVPPKNPAIIENQFKVETRANTVFHGTLRFTKDVVSFQDIISDYNFPIFDFAQSTGGPLAHVVYFLLTKFDLFRKLNINEEKCVNFFTAVENGYHSNPYHSSTHAADVVQTLSYFLQLPNANRFYRDIDLLACIFAAAVHDLDHPGRTNNFLINTQDSRAVLYNDRAVLENHHVSTAFRLLKKDESNFISHFTKPEAKQFRELVVDMVLATDMVQHMALLTFFKNRINSEKELDPEVREDVLLLSRIIIKIADISNATKSFNLYEKWYKLVLDEWMLQGDEEKELGLDISPYMVYIFYVGP
eukprot:NODE_184_length_13742_cov_0.550539.p1 type:complete len:722 gc:universal NODE_184_length_13742_cov_0.550539:9675-7510(-)